LSIRYNRRHCFRIILTMRINSVIAVNIGVFTTIEMNRNKVWFKIFSFYLSSIIDLPLYFIDLIINILFFIYISRHSYIQPKSNQYISQS